MKIQCPDCKKVYQVDDSKIHEAGTFVKCKCETKFFIKKDTLEAEEKPKIQKESRAEEAEIRASRPYRLGTHVCWTECELAVAMCENWDDATKRVARRADLERWLTHDLNDQNLLNTFLDITEIPAITPEMLLITFLQVLLPGAIPAVVDAVCLEPYVLKTCLQASTGVTEGQRRLGQLLWSGKEMPVDPVEAERLLRIAASKGDEEALTEIKEIEQINEIIVAAQAGQADSQYSLGEMYRDGIRVAKNEAEAVKWYQKAAKQGHASAQYNLGCMYDLGIGVARNESEAVKWYQKAAEQGNADGQQQLGTMYDLGIGVARNESEAVKWYQKAAEQGHANGQYFLGSNYYEHGDESEAVKWFQKAAEQGDGWAQFRLGGMYEDGEGVAKNDEEAFKWFEKAAKQGKDAEWQFKLGLMYENGQGVARNDEEAFKWFQKTAEWGEYAGWQFKLGLMYENGQGVAKNDSEAFKWFEKAAKQGMAVAQYNLALMYDKGRGVAKNDEAAFKWLQKAAGGAGVQYSIGNMYRDDERVATNLAEAAFNYFRKAAEQGHACAQNYMGLLYRDGSGVVKDEAEAVKWFEKAAEQGMAGAQSNLAVMYQTGRGVAQNYSESVKWYKKAAEQGDASAQDNLERVRRVCEKRLFVHCTNDGLRRLITQMPDYELHSFRSKQNREP